MDWLNGKKTYIGTVAGSVLAFVVAMGWLDADKAAPIAALIAGVLGVGVAHKLEKAAK